MKFTFLVIGKTNLPFVLEGLCMYEKRLSFYINFTRVEVPELKGVKSFSQQEIKKKEGDLILKFLKSTDDLILLDERGEYMDSDSWASVIEKKINLGKDVVFVVGGAYGFSQEVYQRANGMLSLSKMTFSHQIIRVIFMEQLYRACTIIKGEPYHHRG